MSRRSSEFFIGALFSLLILVGNGPFGCARAGGDQELVVFAASSLTDVFRDLERGFEEANPGVDVVVSFAGSQLLRVQIEQGAPAHVFASANTEHIDALVTSGSVRAPSVFAHNELVVAVPAANPADA